MKAELHVLCKRNAHLQSQTARVEAVSTVPIIYDYVAMHAGNELDENEEFHDSFDLPQERAPPGTSIGNHSGQFSTPLAQNRGPTGSQDEIAELTAAIAQAKAKNNKLECRADFSMALKLCVSQGVVAGLAQPET